MIGDAIDGVVAAPLRVIEGARGAVLHMLCADWPLFTGFGEVYFSEINPGVVKAWKRHRRMTQRLAVPVGRVKFVLYDDRSDSLTRSHVATCELGRPDAYRLLIIPPGVWYGWQGLALAPSLLANCTDLPHDPAESDYVEALAGVATDCWSRIDG